MRTGTLVVLLLAACFGAGLFSAGPTHATGTTYLVDTTSDSNLTACTGAANDCSLRGAVADANVDAIADVIDFAIGTGPQTIAPTVALPQITEPVTIDGTSQPRNGSCPAPKPCIDLQGNGHNGYPGIKVGAAGVVVEGLAIYNFSQGIDVEGNGDMVEGNYIGTKDGVTAGPGNADGVDIGGIVMPNDTVIGGTTLAARNIISGNTDNGVNYFLGLNNQIIGNYIGTTADGMSPLPNNSGAGGGLGGIANAGPGLTIGGSTGTSPGGACTGDCNVISGNSLSGVYVTGSVVIQGNFVGLNVSGTGAIPNTDLTSGAGILVDVGTSHSTVTIGGTSAAVRNVISGNKIFGVAVGDTTNSTLTIQGNYIGTGSSGTTSIPNTQDGIDLFGSKGVLIGGNTTASGNTIRNNALAGVHVGNINTLTATDNSILTNSIDNNGVNGIRLEAGTNDSQASPSLTGAESGGGGTQVQGSLTSAASKTFRIQFFDSPACTTGGPGLTFIGETNVTTDSGGHASIAASLLSAATVGHVVSATATNPAGSTSAFSSCVTVTATAGTADLSVTKSALPNPAKMANPLTYTVTVNNGGASGATGVTLTDTLPGAVTFGSATPSQGSCSQASGVVTCPLGSIANGGNATVSIVVTPTTGNPLVNTATVSGNESDPNGANNTVTITTPALWKCTKSDATVVYRDWPTPAGDDDCDGFTTTAENFAGTLPLVACSPTTSPDHAPDEWPVDFNNDQKATISDVLKYSPVFNTTGPGLPYLVRFDLNGDNHINLSDVLKFSPFFNKPCANP